VVVQEGLQDQDGCYLVDQGLVFLAGFAGCVEDGVGFAGGEALVPEMEREVGEGGELFGENAGFFGLRAGLAGEVERVAGDDCGALVLAAEAGEGAQVVFGVALAGEGEDRLGG
jgi:hypothetical protein